MKHTPPPTGAPLRYIDLFAGAGGLSEGFYNAGFKAVAHVEMDREACDTLRTRLAWYHLNDQKTREPYFQYLRGEISRAELYRSVPQQLLDSVINQSIGEDTRAGIFASIDAQLALLPKAERQVDLIVGGPPCQTFSVMGRARVGREAMEQDPRSLLYLQYVKFLEKYQPRMFVFENVLGLLSFRQHQQLGIIEQAFLEAGYRMEVHVWNAKQFGVLQRRERLIIIGWRISDEQLGYPKFDTISREEEEAHTVGELLQHLPPLRAGETYTAQEYPVGLSEDTPYILKSGLRKLCPVITWHTARPHKDYDLAIYARYIDHWNTYGETRPRPKYNELPDHLIKHENRDDFGDRFKVVAGNLSHSQTVVAHINRDGHYYIHPNRDQCRSLSVREAARLQSFPDNFFFEGSRTAVFRQIGNAVPPLMATRIAESIRLAFEGKAEFLPARPAGQRPKMARPPKRHVAAIQTVLSFDPNPVSEMQPA